MDNKKKNCFQRMKAIFLGILIILILFLYALFTSNDFLVQSVPTIRQFTVRPTKNLSRKGSISRNFATKFNFTTSVTTSKPTASTTKTVPKNWPEVNAENTYRRDNFTAVLLLTYMRSGSSLTGDILQQPEDAFYVFEPLKNVQRLALQKDPISFPNGTFFPYGTYDVQNVYYNTLMGWFTCNLTRIYTAGILDVGFLAFGRNFRGYRKCIVRAVRFNITSDMFAYNKKFLRKPSFRACIGMIERICLKSKYRVIKTIRADMKLGNKILTDLDASKVIHLVRDPRATLESKSHRAVCPKGLETCIEQHCTTVREDTAVKQNLTLKFPARIQTVRYEDIATQPVETTRAMYEFIGMPFTAFIAKYVYNITLGEDKSGCDVCKVRWQIGKSNSSSETHVDAWKQKMSPVYINKTQELCGDIIKQYRYEYFVAKSAGKRTQSVKKLRKKVNRLSKFSDKVETFQVFNTSAVKNHDLP